MVRKPLYPPTEVNQVVLNSKLAALVFFILSLKDRKLEMIVIKETILVLALSVAVLTGLIAMYKLIKFQAFRPIINLNLEAQG